MVSNAEDAWLERLNFHRGLARLKVAREDADFSPGELLGACDLVKNYAPYFKAGVNPGAAMHAEDPGNEWYTDAGSMAARQSDLYGGSGPPMSGESAIDGWTEGVFHRPSLLDPSLTAAAYGLYLDGSGCWVGGLGMIVDKHSNWEEPVKFPGEGSETTLKHLSRGEWPDALTNCPGFSYSCGLPITIELGFGRGPVVSSAILRREQEVLPACIVSAENY